MQEKSRLFTVIIPVIDFCSIILPKNKFHKGFSIAEIMTAIEYSVKNPDRKHGTIRVGLMPDERSASNSDGGWVAVLRPG